LNKFLSVAVALAISAAAILLPVEASASGMQFLPAAAAGGSNNFLGLCNAYNNKEYTSVVADSTSNWAGTGASTFAPADASTNNRITYIDCLGTATVSVSIQSSISDPVTAGGVGFIGFARDATNTNQAAAFNGALGTETGASVSYHYKPALGLHFIQATEYSGLNTVHFSQSVPLLLSVGINGM
jgi:hypothetical protein